MKNPLLKAGGFRYMGLEACGLDGARRLASSIKQPCACVGLPNINLSIVSQTVYIVSIRCGNIDDFHSVGLVFDGHIIMLSLKEKE